METLDAFGLYMGWFSLGSIAVKTKRAGFFKQLSHGDSDGPDLFEAISPQPHPHKDRIAAYLRNGTPVVLCPGVSVDVVANDGTLAEPPHILTDGVWEWPLDYVYYIERYNANVPDELVERIVGLD